MLYFPSNVDPLFVDGTTHSCISAQTYCAYHSSFQRGNVMVRFGVMPDVSAHGCAGGCGAGQPFDNLTVVSSHELIEAVTDPDANTAWVDSSRSCSPSGEIGDLCAGTSDMVNGFAVQKEWSNALKSCVVENPTFTLADFAMALAPATVTVPQGGMATTTITLTQNGGNAANAALTATPPTGLTATFAPASATTMSGTSMVTIAAAPTATLGMSKLTVKAATMAGVSHTQDITVTVVAPPDMAMSPDLAQPQGGGGSGGGGGGTGGNGNHPGNAGGCSCSIADHGGRRRIVAPRRARALRARVPPSPRLARAPAPGAPASAPAAKVC